MRCNSEQSPPGGWHHYLWNIWDASEAPSTCPTISPWLVNSNQFLFCTLANSFDGGKEGSSHTYHSTGVVFLHEVLPLCIIILKAYWRRKLSFCWAVQRMWWCAASVIWGFYKFWISSFKPSYGMFSPESSMQDTWFPSTSCSFSWCQKFLMDLLMAS